MMIFQQSNGLIHSMSTQYMKSNQLKAFEYRHPMSNLSNVQENLDLKAVGVLPVYFLNAVLKLDLELKPTSYMTSSTVSLLSLDSRKILLASSMR